MQHIAEHRFPDASALASALSGEIRVELSEAIAARNHASLVVSGGRTPVQLFHQLANEPLPWRHVLITLADERWVETNHEASNECLVRSELLREGAKEARFVGLKNAAASAAEGTQWAWRSLSRLPRPFDVLLLGMGDDGHTASLFPQSPGLAEALNTSRPPGCVAMQAPTFPHERMSLNLTALLDTRRIILHIQGDSKWQVYQQAKQRGPVTECPVRAVLHQQDTPVEVFWSP